MKEVTNEISFADSEFKTFELKESGELAIYLESWDEKKIKLKFYRPIHFTFKLGDVVAGVYEIPEGGAILDEALSICYTSVPNNHPYKLYAVIDIADFRFIEVVAENISVTKE